MGNYISCTLSTAGSKHWRGIKVIFPSGEIEEFEEGVKAAELMLEMPSFFVVNTRSLQIGQRFCALNADEELECGNVYVMHPMKRLNSVVRPSDMGALLLTAKRVTAKVRVVPEKQVEEPKFNFDDIEEFSSPEFVHRLSITRSKKPLLETIAEEPVCARS
ncbi:uncharacterized protein LOC124825606 [Vigna umbellata]|uniref:DUF4228 domain-containing protein n=2 Tax=Phaseolus angularis TaxID=3914 RepID=A0A0L9T5I7_PHAAN|nr:uncharacterized protein LOC108318969 [Vigna angularis]XP_047154213.1 uncharacterized protein LOC124825606 [Vigna umbellata]KOM25374.1 hypothetical protein LR48_Vigan102s003200 [Vigna angularis]BAU00906.1 hypothetical protein VIGAN_11004200 [Vigna angularis var. angularis]